MSFYESHFLFSHLTKCVSLTVSKFPIVALLILDTLYKCYKLFSEILAIGKKQLKQNISKSRN